MAKTKSEEPVKISAKSQIDQFLKDNEDYHFNFTPLTDYKVSSGSLILDIEMGGGLRPGITRFSGITEGGKTSCALSFARNFQNTVADSHVVYFKSEGRLSEDMLARSGINQSPEKFRIIKSNVYETVGQLIIQLINNNPSNTRYMFIVDSMDSLSPQEDVNKVFGVCGRVAGTAALTADFLKKMSLPIAELGHICIMISQVRCKVEASKYAKHEHQTTNASGGNAPLHYSDWILEFQHHTRKEDKIFLNGDEAKEVVGHNCRIIFRKSMNEKTGTEICYPIKYKRTNGNSIWIEREVMDAIMMFELAKKKGSWIAFEDSVVEEVKKAGLDLVVQLQGIEKFYTYLENNGPITQYFFNKFRDTLQKTP